mmetsp:Transcript_1046/g.2272  ORF Transcript_1046/g.2272 Transcript_1046/m.2272 type:complete len:255 (+) Transcript_1046:236-1000(+)
MCPVSDQLTRQTGPGNVCNRCPVHGSPFPFCDQTMTVPSSEQLATMLTSGKITGAQATSRTQSPCEALALPSVDTVFDWSSTHSPVSDCWTQNRIWLSHPPVTNRGCSEAPLEPSAPPSASTPSLPPLSDSVPVKEYAPDGDQLTEFTPRGLSLIYSTDHELSSWRDKILTFPSELAAATISPHSGGAKHRLLTELRCKFLAEYRIDQSLGRVSRYSMTEPSNEHAAKITPNIGWHHETCQTGPSAPVNVAANS